MRRLLLAIGFLTRVPVPLVRADAEDVAAAIRFYPVAGLLVGAVVAAAGAIGGRADPWVGAIAAVVAWSWITGALHLDGLADLADGLGAAHGDRTRLLAVMADPHVGSFGVVALVLQLLAKCVLLHALGLNGWWPLLIVPAAARMAPLVWARYLPPLKPGLGAGVSRAVRARDIAGWAAVLLAASVFLPPILATAPLTAAFAFWLRRRIGGVTGDAHGAGIEIIETGLLLFVVATRGL